MPLLLFAPQNTRRRKDLSRRKLLVYEILRTLYIPVHTTPVEDMIPGSGEIVFGRPVEACIVAGRKGGGRREYTVYYGRIVSIRWEDGDAEAEFATEHRPVRRIEVGGFVRRTLLQKTIASAGGRKTPERIERIFRILRTVLNIVPEPPRTPEGYLPDKLTVYSIGRRVIGVSSDFHDRNGYKLIVVGNSMEEVEYDVDWFSGEFINTVLRSTIKIDRVRDLLNSIRRSEDVLEKVFR